MMCIFHKWVYSHSIDPEKRVCLKCGRLEVYNWPRGGWYTSEGMAKHHKSKLKPTFNEKYPGGNTL